jgi:hypothetical protein
MVMTNTETATPTELKSRVLALRSKLPQNVRALVMEHYPEYDSRKGSTKLNNVLSGASSDLKLTEILESLAVQA